MIAVDLLLDVDGTLNGVRARGLRRPPITLKTLSARLNDCLSSSRITSTRSGVPSAIDLVALSTPERVMRNKITSTKSADP